MRSYSDISEIMTGYPLDKVVVFDTETTGLNSWEDEILSISIMDGKGSTLLDTYVRPTSKRVWPEAEAINGISPSMVRNSPTIDDIADQIRDALYGDKLIVGYNVDFDLRFLTGQNFIDYPRHTFDVMDEYARVHGSGEKRGGRYKWSKLGKVAAYYGYDLDAHKSANDTRATLYCYLALLSDKKYIAATMDEKSGNSNRLSFRQGEREKNEIFRLLNGARSVEYPATIVLSAVTRGKNAGMPRYECMVGGSCVGVTSPSEVEVVRRYFALDYSDELPESIAGSVSLGSNGSYTSCEVRIEEASPLKSIAVEMSAGMREHIDSMRRSAKAKAVEKKEEKAQGSRPVSHYAPKKAKKVSVPRVAIAIFVCLMSIAVLASGISQGIKEGADIAAIFVLSAVAALSGFYAYARIKK